MLFGQNPNLWRFFLRSFFLFCLLFPLWGYLSPFYTELLAAFVQRLILFTLPRGELNPEWVVGLKVKGNTIILTNPFESSSFYLAGFDATQVHGNLPLLLALFLATPGVSLNSRSRAKRLGLALGVLLLWHAGHTLFLVKLLESQGVLYASPHQAETVRTLLRAAVPNVVLQTFVFQLVPFLLWTVFLCGPLRQAREQGSDSVLPGKIRRNDPCPCGSSQKYKQCCGGG